LNDIIDKQLTACAFKNDGVIYDTVRRKYSQMVIQDVSKVAKQQLSGEEGGSLQVNEAVQSNEYAENIRQDHCQAAFTFATSLISLKTDPANCDISRVGQGDHGDLPLEPHSKGGAFAFPRAPLAANATVSARTECIRQSVTAAMGRVVNSGLIEDLDHYYFPPAKCTGTHHPPPPTHHPPHHHHPLTRSQ
jgi:hypothetical protein